MSTVHFHCTPIVPARMCASGYITALTHTKRAHTRSNRSPSPSQACLSLPICVCVINTRRFLRVPCSCSCFVISSRFSDLSFFSFSQRKAQILLISMHLFESRPPICTPPTADNPIAAHSAYLRHSAGPCSILFLCL